MPIWANDLDGLEPNFRHKGKDVFGVGLFDPASLASIERHSTVLRIGSKDKQFQVQWLLNNNGEAIGYLASRVVPEEEYKRLYGGTGEGLQEAYVIGLNEFFEFGKNTDKYYDYSRNAELADVMYGEIERHPVKRYFDPRGWLLGRLIGATGSIGSKMLGTTTLLGAMERGIAARGISGATFTESQLTKLITTSAGDDVITLYRGMTGTEKGAGTLFLAETQEYAAAYSSNVQKFQISRFGYKKLLNEGLIKTNSGIAPNGAKGIEIEVNNQTIKNIILNQNK